MGESSSLEQLLPDLPAPVRFGKAPTPLEHRPELGTELGVDFYLKREDAIDDLGCGNKVRKLEHILAEALRRQATVLVTAGSLASNQCKAVAAAAAQHGLRAHLVYGGDHQVRPDAPTGNYLIAALFRPSVSWFERSPWHDITVRLDAVVRDEAARGARPYLIPPGASAWPGLLGSLELGFEIASQLDERGVREADIVAAAGSGGTCLGIATAAALLGITWSVHGIAIGGPIDRLRADAGVLREDAAARTGRPEIRRAEVEWHADWIGAGYDAPTPGELDTMRELVSAHGLLFDPNYMVKAFIGLRALIASNALGKRPVVLVHTGGHFGVFGIGVNAEGWYKSRLAAFVR